MPRTRNKTRKRKGKDKGKTYHKLINSGGQGCIFKPAFPCKKKSKRTHKGKQTISKVFFHKHFAKREYDMDKRIRKIKGYGKWCILWDVYCETPSYKQISTNSDIAKCLSKKNITHAFNDSYQMLIRDFGGITFYEHVLKETSKQTFMSQSTFDIFLSNLFQSLRNVFYGILQLQENNISHGDITIRNIIFKKNNSFLIDFGLAYEFSNKQYIENHLEFLFRGTDRIYEAYPYDYQLYHGYLDTPYLLSEYNDMVVGINRQNQDEHVSYHEILGSTQTRKKIHQFMEDTLSGHYTPNLHEIIQSLDTYSVGMLIPIILHDLAQEYKISIPTLLKRCKGSQHQGIFELLRDMTQFYSKDRITPHEAYKRFTGITHHSMSRTQTS